MGSITINERVEKIKGNKEEINTLIEEYKPFIASCVQKSTGRYVRYGEDDELSIGMIAFSEAINSYDSTKGSFLSFASGVIGRRLIDYYRKEKRHDNVVPLIDDSDEEIEADYSIKQSLENYSQAQISEHRRLEIEEIKKELAEFDISFYELTAASPKHESTKKLYKDIIKYIKSQPLLIEIIKTRKQLPVKEIEQNLKVSRKKIERGRKYIIAVILIITGDYQYIKEYVDWW